MSNWLLAIIVFVIFAIIIGNILLLKQTANNKIPSLKDYKPNGENDGFKDDEDDDKPSSF